MNLFKPASIEGLSKSKQHYLEMSYPMFVQLQNQLLNTDFYSIPKEQRYANIQQFLGLFSQIKDYEIIKKTSSKMTIGRFEDVKALFDICRNVFSHFGYFTCWDEVWITKKLAADLFNGKGNGSIYNFLNTPREILKFKWEISSSKQVFYIDIKFPNNPEEEERIYLKDIIDEYNIVLLASVQVKILLMGHLSNNPINITFY